MAKIIGSPIPSFLPKDTLVVNGVYATSDDKLYKIARIGDLTVAVYRVFKCGRVSETPHRGIYGETLFFHRNVSLPMKSAPQPSPIESKEAPKEVWTCDGRTLHYKGLPMFTLDKRVHMAPADLDIIGRKIAAFLNIQDIT